MSAPADNPWIAEAFLQWGAALRWRRLAAALNAARHPATQRFHEALNLFLMEEWLPGGFKLVEKVADLKPVEDAFCRGLASNPPAQLGEKPEALGPLLLEALKASLAAPVEKGAAPTPQRIDGIAPARMAALWFRQGCALHDWTVQSAALLEVPAPAAAPARTVASPQTNGALTSRCRTLIQRIDHRTGAASGTARLLSLLRDAKDSALLVEASQVLAACVNSMAIPQLAEELPPDDVPTPTADCAPLVQKVNEALARARDDWPAQLVARLLARWRAAAPDALPTALRSWEPAELGKWAAHFAKSELGRMLPGEDAGRLLLLRGLTGVADGLVKDAPALAEAVYSALRDTIKAAVDPKRWSVQLIREPKPDRGESLDKLYKSEPSPSATAMRLVASGLLVHGMQANASNRAAAMCFPMARLEVPPEKPHPVTALYGLLAWLAATGKPEHGVRAAALALLQAWDDPNEGLKSFSLPRWWEKAPEAERACLWWFAQRVALLARLEPESETAVAGVVQALAAEKFALMPTTGGATESTTPWFLEPASSGDTAPQWSLLRGAALHTPTGVFGSTFFLRLRADTAAANPFTDTLRALEPFLAAAHFADPEWNGQTVVNAAVSEAASGIGDPAPQALALLKHFYRRSKNAPPAAHAPYRDIVRRLYSLLTGTLGVRVVPELDADGAPKRLPPDARGVVELVADVAPAGTVLAVERFGTADDPPPLRVSLGPRLPDEVARWFHLPHPVEKVNECQVLVAWRSRVRAVLWEPPERQADAYRKVAMQTAAELADFLGTDDGKDWFDHFARAATRDAEARAWLNRIVAENWCGCFPVVDPDSGAPRWAEAMSANSRGVSVRFTPEQDVPVRVGEVGFFAPTADAARCDVWLREPDAGSPLAAARAMAAAADHPATAAVLRSETDASLHAAPPNAARMLPLLLDVLAALPELGAADAARADRLLAAARLWAAAAQLDILPRRWRYSQPLPAAELHPDEPPTRVEFSPCEAGMVAAVRRFGYAGPKQTTVPPEVVASGGPKPEGWDELRALLLRANANAARPLLDALKRMPDAGRKGELPAAFIDFYKQFWDAEREWRHSDPPNAAAVREALATALAKNFDWIPFVPEGIELNDPRKAEMKLLMDPPAGKVVEVFRPGLKRQSDSTAVVSAKVSVK